MSRMKRYLISVFLLLCTVMCAMSKTSEEDWVLRAEDFTEGKYYGVTSANGVVGIISSKEPFIGTWS